MYQSTIKDKVQPATDQPTAASAPNEAAQESAQEFSGFSDFMLEILPVEIWVSLIGLLGAAIGGFFTAIWFLYFRNIDYTQKLKEIAAPLLAEVNQAINEHGGGTKVVSHKTYAAFRLHLNKKDGKQMDKRWDEYLEWHKKKLRYLNPLQELKTLIHQLTKS